MTNSRRRHSKRLLPILLIISAVAILLPRSITGRLIGLVQVLVPFQDWTGRGADAAGELVHSRDQLTELEALRRQNLALSHQLSSLASRYYQLENDFESVAAVRRRGFEGGRLIPARVVGHDASTWRDSRLITAGMLSGVRDNAGVTSDHFSIDLDGKGGVRSGLSIVAGEVLVGFIEQVGTHSSRVRLLNDLETQMPVVVARLQDDRFLPLEAQFWMTGTGGRLLKIHDVDHRYIKSEAIKVGDTVLTVPHDSRLPASLTIGTIVEMNADQDDRLLYILDVEPAIDYSDLSRVFVVDPQGDAAQ